MHCPKSGKDDGDYNSPKSRDETLDDKKRGHKKRAQKIQKNYERKREKGQCYYPFTTLVLQSSTMFFIYRESLDLSLSYTSGNFHYSTWLAYSNDGRPQNALGLREQASWMHTHLVLV